MVGGSGHKHLDLTLGNVTIYYCSARLLSALFSPWRDKPRNTCAYSCPADGTPDTRHLAYTARIGQGALITPASGAGEAGFLLPRAAHDAMIAAVQHAGVPYQLAVTGGGMTDAAAAHLVGGGITTHQVKIPRRYSHSPVELLDLRDLAATLALVEELVLHPPTVEAFSFLKDVEHS